MRFALFCSALLLCVGSPVNLLLATDFYVSSTGNDTTGDGSSGSPWRTITRAINAPAASGDVIHAATGLYRTLEGEVFPIQLPAGVTVQGPTSGGAAEVIAPPGSVFRLLPGTDLTTLSDLSIENSGSGTLVLDSGVGTYKLRLTNNNMVSAGNGVYLDAGFNTVELEAVGNTIQAAGRGIDLDDALPFVFIARNNTITVSGNGLDLEDAYLGTASITSNILIDADTSTINDGILAGDNPNPGQTALLNVRKNQIYGMENGLALNLAAYGRVGYEITGNRIVQPNRRGVFMPYQLHDNRPFLFEGNTIQGAGNAGVLIDWREDGFSSGVSLELGGPVQFNTITDCGGNGIGISLLAQSCSSFSCGGVQMDLTGPFVGNTLSGNNNGLRLKATDTGAWIFSFLPPAMGGGGIPGRNTLDGNEQMALKAFSNGPRLTFHAQGNWWGTTDPVAIEDMVEGANDRPDGLPFNLNDPLVSEIEIAPAPEVVLQAGGESVTVQAGANGAFVPFAGDTQIQVTIGGLPAENVQVAADGLSLTFDTPSFPFGGVANLVIVNPNGTRGTHKMWVKPSARFLKRGPLTPQ